MTYFFALSSNPSADFSIPGLIICGKLQQLFTKLFSLGHAKLILECSGQKFPFNVVLFITVPLFYEPENSLNPLPLHTLYTTSKNCFISFLKRISIDVTQL